MTYRKKLSLRPPPLQIERGTDPFKEFDKLGRKGSIERLTHLLQNVGSPFVLGIDSAWGTGKTTFLQLWDWHLQHEGFQTVFFNAWEHDYLDDPLLALLAEITRDTKTVSEQKREKVLKAAGQLLRKSLPVAVRLLSQGLIDLDKGEEAIAEILETAARDKIQEFEDSKSTSWSSGMFHLPSERQVHFRSEATESEDMPKDNMNPKLRWAQETIGLLDSEDFQSRHTYTGGWLTTINRLQFADQFFDLDPRSDQDAPTR